MPSLLSTYRQAAEDVGTLETGCHVSQIARSGVSFSNSFRIWASTCRPALDLSTSRAANEPRRCTYSQLAGDEFQPRRIVNLPRLRKTQFVSRFHLDIDRCQRHDSVDKHAICIIVGKLRHSSIRRLIKPLRARRKYLAAVFGNADAMLELALTGSGRALPPSSRLPAPCPLPCRC